MLSRANKTIAGVDISNDANVYFVVVGHSFMTFQRELSWVISGSESRDIGVGGCMRRIRPVDWRAIRRDRYVQLRQVGRAASSASTIAVAAGRPTGFMAPSVRPAMDCRLAERTDGRAQSFVSRRHSVSRSCVTLESWRQSSRVGLHGSERCC